MKYLGNLQVNDPLYEYLRYDILPLFEVDGILPISMYISFRLLTLSTSTKTSAAIPGLSENFLVVPQVIPKRLPPIIWNGNSII